MEGIFTDLSVHSIVFFTRTHRSSGPRPKVDVISRQPTGTRFLNLRDPESQNPTISPFDMDVVYQEQSFSIIQYMIDKLRRVCFIYKFLRRH